MSEYIKSLKSPIAIIGMGKSGAAARRMLLASGIAESEVFTFDTKQKDAQFKNPELMMAEISPKTFVVSPGVPLSSPWIQTARTQGVYITSEINLACSALRDEKLIGVTGSVGKSTTVSILEAGLKAFSKTAFVGGNLGIPFCEYATDVVLGNRPCADWVVLELSSYQLENSILLKLDLSAITYLTSNHLERYENLHEYYETKCRIVEFTKNEVILNQNGGDLRDFCHGKESSKLIWSEPHLPELACFHLETASLIGEHNQDNLAIAAMLALRACWPLESIRAMKEFTGLQHRLENLGEFNQIRFINDSKATALDSVLIAVAATVYTRKPNSIVHVLLGGKDKGLPWDTIGILSNYPNMSFLFFGESREVAQKKSHLPGSTHEHLISAIQQCLKIAKPGDTVLLSPGGTSLDAFKNFEDRGDFFKAQVALFAKTKDGQ